MNRNAMNLLIGGLVGLISGYLIEKETLWKTFAFLWAAPILLFVPIYVSYYKDKTYIREFLGVSLSVILIILTLLLLNVNIILSLLVNLGLSLVAVHLYFKHKMYL